MLASARVEEKEKDEAAVASSRRRKAAVILQKSGLMLGKHGTGKIKAGMKIGPRKNKLKNPTPPKEKKERKERQRKREVEQRWER